MAAHLYIQANGTFFSIKECFLVLFRRLDVLSDNVTENMEVRGNDVMGHLGQLEGTGNPWAR